MEILNCCPLFPPLSFDNVEKNKLNKIIIITFLTSIINAAIEKFKKHYYVIN